MQVDLYPHQSLTEWSDEFEEKYDLVKVLMTGDSAFSRNKSIKQDGRQCAFCGKTYSEVTFRNAAHLLPSMIGNTDLFSTFECDRCNNKFSRYETDLSYFMGLSRSIMGMFDKKMPPGFEGLGIKAKSFMFNEKKILVIRKEGAKFNKDTGCTPIQYQKPTYTPANIYRLFLKCAISTFPPEEIKRDFKMALGYLQGKSFLGGAHIHLYRFPLQVNMPLHLHLFKKRNSDLSILTYIANMYFDNLVISFPVLLHEQDLNHVNSTIQTFAAPPYFVEDCDIHPIKPTFERIDLSSETKIKRQPEELMLQFDNSMLDNSIKLNVSTGEETETAFNPSGSKYFVLPEQGASFTKEELIELSTIIQKLLP